MSDISVGLRLLWKDKAFTITVALTLALCIGANTALFSVVHNVLLRPLPVPDSNRILLISNSYPKAGAPDTGYSGVPDYYDRLRQTNVFEEQALFNTRDQSIDRDQTPTRIEVMAVTPSFFRLVKVPAKLGRTFTDAEGEIGAEKKAVLSYALWQSAFGGDPGVVGKDVRLDGQPYSIVGIMPRDFVFVSRDAMLWTPLAFTAEQKSDATRHSNNWQHIGRLKPGATREQAQAQINAINAANLDRFPEYRQLLINSGFEAHVLVLQDYLVRDVKAILYMMWAGALFVLLIGVVNVANLVLVRSKARHKELATRLALGAGRARIVRQLVTESLILTMGCAAAGLLVGEMTLRLLGSINIQDLPRGNEIRLDGVVMIYAVGIAALIGLALGLIPVASLLPANLTVVLREEGRTGTSGRGARTLRRTLVVAQVAFAFVLLVGAGLLFASFRRVLAVEPGFRPQGVLTASVSLPRSRYRDDKALVALTHEALRRLRALPGVIAAGAADWIPLSGSNSNSVILAEGYQMQPGESVISPSNIDATPGYFDAMGTTLVRGRVFDDRDGPDAPRVTIVDEKLARRFWPNQDPIGRRLYRPDDINHLLVTSAKTRFFTVIGVVREVKLHTLTEGKETVGAYYFPMDQDASRGITFTLKTAGDPTALTSSVRGALAEVDRQLPVFDARAMEQVLEKSLVSRRSPVLLALSFGAVALFLSAIGIYGVLAYLVTQRTKEIGIRMALGSSPVAIFELVLREGLVVIGAGFVLGATGAFALHRTLESQLFGVASTDPLVLGTVASVLALVAILACVLPARRATRISPLVALAE